MPEHGYRIRLRIDPGILYEHWRADYADLIRKALAVLEPENITLGMLRLVPGHLSLARQAYGIAAQVLQGRRSFRESLRRQAAVSGPSTCRILPIPHRRDSQLREASVDQPVP